MAPDRKGKGSDGARWQGGVRKVRLSDLQGNLLYEGDVEGLPPGEAREYWEAVKAHYGGRVRLGIPQGQGSPPRPGLPGLRLGGGGGGR